MCYQIMCWEEIGKFGDFSSVSCNMQNTINYSCPRVLLSTQRVLLSTKDLLLSVLSDDGTKAIQ